MVRQLDDTGELLTFLKDGYGIEVVQKDPYKAYKDTFGKFNVCSLLSNYSEKNVSNDKLVVGIQEFIVPFFQLFYTFDIHLRV